MFELKSNLRILLLSKNVNLFKDIERSNDRGKKKKVIGKGKTKVFNQLQLCKDISEGKVKRNRNRIWLPNVLQNDGTRTKYFKENL